MIGLVILTVLSAAGCLFLVYFMIALWRDSYKQRRGSRVEIRRFTLEKRPRGKLVRMHNVAELRERRRQ